MDHRLVETLEREIKEALAVIVLRRTKGAGMPLPPSPRTMHLMAKAAVAVYEAVVDERRPRAEPGDDAGPEP